MTAPSAAAIADRRSRFRALHEAGCFLLPNAWDAGSARLLQSAGFEAIASTSSGFAWSRGQADSHPSLESTLDHLRALVAATELPVNADFVDGFGATPADVESAVSRAVQTGVAGVSIEDAWPPGQGDGEAVRTVEDAVDRIKAARRAIDESGHDVMLVGRAENFIVGRPDLADTIRRLTAYSEAGADCLYAPGVRDPAHIRAVVEAVAPKPVNVLAGPGASLADLEALGVRRVSVGGALARVAWAATMQAAAKLKEGDFSGLDGAAGHAELEEIMRR